MFGRSRTVYIVLIILTFVLGGLAIWIGWRLSTEDTVTPEGTEAASEQVTNADKLKTQAQRDDFAARWEKFVEDKTHDIWDYIKYALTDEGGRYECDTVIMDNVGDETLYGCDLNVVFVIHDFQTYTSSEAINAQNSGLNTVLDELITQSGLLQKAAELDVFSLDSTFFNAPTKDHIKRLDRVSLARDEIGDLFIKTVDFEAIVIYFHNQKDPLIPIGQAQQAAKNKMDLLYARLQNGEITMEQAGEEISSDNITGDTTGVSLSDLDPVFGLNAYMKITGHQFDQQIFVDSTYDEELKSLGEGQISTVRLFKDFKFEDEDIAKQLLVEDTAEMVDSGYIIFKLNKINFGLQGDLTGDNPEEVDSKIKDSFDDNVDIKL